MWCVTSCDFVPALTVVLVSEGNWKRREEYLSMHPSCKVWTHDVIGALAPWMTIPFEAFVNCLLLRSMLRPEEDQEIDANDW